MRIAELHEFQRRRRRRYADCSTALAVGEHVVVLAGSRASLPEANHVVERLALLERPSHQRGHRHAVPIALTLAPNLAERDAAVIHAADAADESGVAHGREGNHPLRSDDEGRGRVLKADPSHVVEHPPVVERAVRGGRPCHREPRTMEEFGKHVHDLDHVGLDVHGPGQRASLPNVTLRDVGFQLLVGGSQAGGEPLTGSGQFGESDHVKNRVHAPPGLGRQQIAVGRADLLGGSPQRHEPLAADPSGHARACVVDAEKGGVSLAPRAVGRRSEAQGGGRKACNQGWSGLGEERECHCDPRVCRDEPPDQAGRVEAVFIGLVTDANVHESMAGQGEGRGFRSPPDLELVIGVRDRQGEGIRGVPLESQVEDLDGTILLVPGELSFPLLFQLWRPPIPGRSARLLLAGTTAWNRCFGAWQARLDLDDTLDGERFASAADAVPERLKVGCQEGRRRPIGRPVQQRVRPPTRRDGGACRGG